MLETTRLNYVYKVNVVALALCLNKHVAKFALIFKPTTTTAANAIRSARPDMPVSTGHARPLVLAVQQIATENA